LVLGTAKDLADALRGDLHQYRRLSNVSSTTTTAMQKPEALALASQLRPPISQPEINTLKKLSSKQRKRLASTTLIELQTIPFLEPSLEASLLVVASFALHDIRRQQQFEVNNDSDPVLRFADGVISDWTKLHRNNTTATQNNINKLFADIRPAFMRIDDDDDDDNNNNNNNNNNQRRSSKQQQKRVNDETIMSLLKLFVVNTDKTAATTIERAVEKQLLLKNIASIGMRPVRNCRWMLLLIIE
jgi:hypothetical protein